MKAIPFSLIRTVLIALVAAYVPTLFWRPWGELGQGGAGVFLTVLSPVALPALFAAAILPLGSLAGGIAFAVALFVMYLLALLALSLRVHRSLASTLLMAYVLFGVSLAQGILCSMALHGFEAMARM
jgi:hypothetical protein